VKELIYIEFLEDVFIDEETLQEIREGVAELVNTCADNVVLELEDGTDDLG